MILTDEHKRQMEKAEFTNQEQRYVLTIMETAALYEVPFTIDSAIESVIQGRGRFDPRTFDERVRQYFRGKAQGKKFQRPKFSHSLQERLRIQNMLRRRKR